jgi:(p)ppGpp synthase/HD superfamily hydrolase
MNDLDGGYDARVYDSTRSCVYAAHTRYKTQWIGQRDESAAFTPRMQKAVRFATKTHEVYQKQKRKGKDIPYITHPLTIGLILSRAGAA